ncbi:hypothetical protein PSPO01_00086 [Paraphaeosphaeria sporulosa]
MLVFESYARRRSARHTQPGNSAIAARRSRARPCLEPQRGLLRLATAGLVLRTSASHAVGARSDNAATALRWLTCQAATSPLTVSVSCIPACPQKVQKWGVVASWHGGDEARCQLLQIAAHGAILPRLASTQWQASSTPIRTTATQPCNARLSVFLFPRASHCSGSHQKCASTSSSGERSHVIGQATAPRARKHTLGSIFRQTKGCCCRSVHGQLASRKKTPLTCGYVILLQLPARQRNSCGTERLSRTPSLSMTYPKIFPLAEQQFGLEVVATGLTSGQFHALLTFIGGAVVTQRQDAHAECSVACRR